MHKVLVEILYIMYMYTYPKVCYNVNVGGDTMARPKLKTNAEVKNAYAKRNYDDVRLQVKKGQKEVIRAYAEAKGLSLNGYINSLIAKDMGDALKLNE